MQQREGQKTGGAGAWLRVTAAAALIGGGLLACHSQTASEVEWGYGTDDGPTRWAALSSEFALCSEGAEQSPIDLGRANPGVLAPLKLNWSASPATLKDNGSAIQVDFSSAGTLALDGRTYSLAQFHVHTPSEHIIDGQPAPLEIHFVHADPDGRLAVVGVMVKSGDAHPALDALTKQLDDIEPEGPSEALGMFDPRTLLPSGEGRMAYPGSLTTPPCSEGVAWNVMTTPITASAAQIAEFAARYPNNARPVKPLGDRSLVISKPTQAAK